MTSPMSAEPSIPATGFHFVDEDAVMTPADAEKFLRRVNNELGRAQLALKRLRYRELGLERIYTERKTALLLSEECPKVGRSEGCVTVDERDTWINARISEYWPFRSAQVQTKNAEEYMKAVNKQASLAQTINNNAKALYETYRGGGR